MPLAAFVTHALKHIVQRSLATDSSTAMAIPQDSELKPSESPAALPVTQRRRINAIGWRRVLIDTGVLHYARGDSRKRARFTVLAEATGLSVDDYVREVEARYTQALRRDDRGRRPMEIEEFAARLRALVSVDPNAAAYLTDLRLRGDEAERRAKIAHQRKTAANKVAAARGMAAVLAAGTLIGATIDAPADPVDPPAPSTA